MYTVYTVTGGKFYWIIFNAIETFVNSKAFNDLFYMALVFSIAFTVMQYIKTHSVVVLATWFSKLVLVSVILIGIKMSIQIVDLSNPTAVYQVDNVPVGLGLPTSLITEMGYGLASEFDTLFSTPDSVTYTKTGILFGAKLLTAQNGVTIPDSKTSNLLQKYIHFCVIGDMYINHKYSLNDLMHSNDLMGLIFAKPSSFVVCLRMDNSKRVQ